VVKKTWLVFAAVAMGIFLSTIDGSIVNVALPTFVNEFHTQFAMVQWVVLGYMLILSSLMLSMGRLGDIIGKKPVYITGMILFTASSLCCGLAPTIVWLIISRLFQAVGASMIVSLGMGILTETFPPRQRGKVLGAAGSIVSIGIITGPTLGGLIIDSLSWHWIFFVNVPIGVIGVLMVWQFLPASHKSRHQRFDFFGAAALFVSLSCFLLALTLSQRFGYTHSIILFLFAVWLVFFIFFLIMEFRVDQPMVDMRLFRNLKFSLSLFTGFATFVTSGGVILLMPFYLQNVLGFRPSHIGLMMAIVPVTTGIISPLAGSLSDRLGTRLISTIGLIIMFFGYLGLLSLGIHTSTVHYILNFIPIGIGLGLFQSPNNSAIMGMAAREKVGVVSSLLSLTRTLGQSAGVAVIGTFWANRVAFYSQAPFKMGATMTAPFFQVQAMHDTIIIACVILGIGMMLNVAAWVCGKGGGKQHLSRVS
jgi:EmrB/QacA subfamily drug resistance transporter